MGQDRYGSTVVSLTIPAAGDSSGATGLSDAMRTENGMIAAIEIPATWVTAAVSFAGAATFGGTYKPIFDSDGTEISITVTAGAIIPLTTNPLAAIPFLKLRSGLSSAPVAQATTRAINVIMR